MNKYRNKKTGGFDSKKEAKRYADLCLMQQAGEISELRKQVTFLLIPSQYIGGKCVERPCKYIADFVYTHKGAEIVEDVKGYRDPVYRIKRKLMLKLLGIRIKEV